MSQAWRRGKIKGGRKVWRVVQLVAALIQGKPSDPRDIDEASILSPCFTPGWREICLNSRARTHRLFLWVNTRCRYQDTRGQNLSSLPESMTTSDWVQLVRKWGNALSEWKNEFSREWKRKGRGKVRIGGSVVVVVETMYEFYCIGWNFYCRVNSY